VRRARLLLAVLLVLAAAGPGLAVNPAERLEDPALEARARELSRELRCLVCQNQSIDDSDAGLARDLRLLVRERIAAGDSNEQVLSYLTDRYGAFVRLRPPFTAATVALWITPVVAALIAIGGAIVYLRGRRTAAPGEAARLSEDEERALRELLEAREARE
jgi:cytochrome c-type biogenesis protein CcmH